MVSTPWFQHVPGGRTENGAWKRTERRRPGRLLMGMVLAMPGMVLAMPSVALLIWFSRIAFPLELSVYSSVISL